MNDRDNPGFRIGFLSAFFGMFENVLGPRYVVEQERVVANQRATLARAFDVVDLGIATSPDSASALADRLASARVDAIVIAPTMVAPPEWITQMIGRHRAPLVLWTNSRTTRLDPRLDHRIATADTSLVGSVMVANCLRRDGREFVAVEAAAGDRREEERLHRVVRAAATAGRLRGAVALRVGTPLPGYRDVEASDAELDTLGVRAVDVSADEFAAAVRGISASRTEALWAEIRSRPGWRVAPNLDPERSLRVAIALADCVGQAGAALGAVNCHGSCFRGHDDVGITACLGVSLCHAAGVPVACTGDLPSAVAGFVARSLTGTAQYCELYVRERDSDEVLIAAGGEGDPAWADTAGVELFAGEYYPGASGQGLAIRFALRAGPATILSATPAAAGWQMIWATGQVRSRAFEKFDGPHGAFTFDTVPSVRALECWVEAGPTHHPYLASGRLDLELPIVARFLKIDEHRV